jgi:large subunit ribosomal protein L14e
VIEKSDLIKKWGESKWAQKLASQATRAKLNDFERFQVMVLKRQVILKHFI